MIVNRFNKKKFNEFMRDLANNLDYSYETTKFINGEIKSKKIESTKEFRRWCKRLLMSAGMDKKDADRVTKGDFVINDMNGLYDFFTSAMYEYMNDGNKFDLIPTKDFKGSIYLKDIPKTKKKSKQYSPKDRSYIGEFEIEKDHHKQLKSSSTCPKYLIKRKKV